MCCRDNNNKVGTAAKRRLGALVPNMPPPLPTPQTDVAKPRSASVCALAPDGEPRGTLSADWLQGGWVGGGDTDCVGDVCVHLFCLVCSGNFCRLTNFYFVRQVSW